MKIVKTKLTTFIFFSLLSNYTSAGESTAWTTIDLLNISNDVTIRTAEETLVNPSYCTRSNYYVLPELHNSHNKILAALILAKSDRNMQVRFYINGCHNDWPKISNVQIQSAP